MHARSKLSILAELEVFLIGLLTANFLQNFAIYRVQIALLSSGKQRTLAQSSLMDSIVKIEAVRLYM